MRGAGSLYTFLSPRGVTDPEQVVVKRGSRAGSFVDRGIVEVADETMKGYLEVGGLFNGGFFMVESVKCDSQETSSCSF